MIITAPMVLHAFSIVQYIQLKTEVAILDTDSAPDAVSVYQYTSILSFHFPSRMFQNFTRILVELASILLCRNLTDHPECLLMQWS